MKFIRKLFNALIFIQFVLFGFYILQNIDSLDNIEYDIEILGTQMQFEINFYSILAVITVFFGLLFLISINILDSGLNETGTQNSGRYISFAFLVSVLTLTNSYYILQFGTVGLIVEIFILIVYLFYAITLPYLGNIVRE